MLAHIHIKDMRQRSYCTNTISRRYHTYRHPITPHHSNAAQLLIPADSRQTKIHIHSLRFQILLIYISQRTRTQGSDEPRCRCRGQSPIAPTTVRNCTVVEFTACRHRRLVPLLARPEWLRPRAPRNDWHQARQVSYALFVETLLPANTTE